MNGGRRAAGWARLTPARLFVAAFAGMVVLGAVGLRLLPGVDTGPGLGWLDSLFTATSAVCVTGLIVVDTATHFTPFGQGWVLFLIQLGGIGIITFSSLAALLLGRRLPIGQQMIVSERSRPAPQVDLRRLLRGVLAFTLLSEGLGMIALTALWSPRLGFGSALWAAVFHSISAFCNAGFSTFSDSLVSWNESAATLAVIMALILVGGVGFLTLVEVSIAAAGALGTKRRLGRLSLHSRMVLFASAVLVVGGALAFLGLERDGVLAGMTPGAQWANAFFLSVTPRTAGFNTVDYAAIHDGSSFLTMILMFIGGGSGSTAGGIKMTTAAVLLLFAIARLRGQREPGAWMRSLPPETVRRALELTLISFLAITLGLFLMASVGSVGPPSFHDEAFEAARAFNTVGLSRGATSGLSPPGKWIVILLMFAGRVGPLTFIAAIAAGPDTKARFRYAREDVAIG